MFIRKYDLGAATILIIFSFIVALVIVGSLSRGSGLDTRSGTTATTVETATVPVLDDPLCLALYAVTETDLANDGAITQLLIDQGYAEDEIYHVFESGNECGGAY